MLIFTPMQHGICLLSAVPCRKEAANTSEMVTQLLFGEQYSILETKEDWLKIKTAYDHYECWMNIKQHHPITSAILNQLQSQKIICSTNLFSMLTHNEQSFPISIGATLPFYINQQLNISNKTFVVEGSTNSEYNKELSIKKLLQTAHLFLNSPYLWGGRTPMGIDCSGFTQLVFKIHGLKLPRDAYQQVELGSALNFVEEAEAGDLAFFDNEEGKIVHVGILLDNERIIHASGYVKIDKFDHYGIFNSVTKKYSHTLRVIKRVV